MRLPIDYNTSIDELLNSTDRHTIFLSTWDKDICKNDIPFEMIKKSVSISINEINKYHYMDEMDEIKKYISNSIFHHDNLIISQNKMAIGTNGTASSYLVLRALSKRKPLRPLLFTPIYFSYIPSLKDFCNNIEFYQVFNSNEIYIDLCKVEQIIKTNQINLLVLNDPVFGCGISIKNDTYREIIYLCQKYGVTLIVDYIYGGMEWDIERHYTHKYLLEEISKNKDVILIDSMPKRLLINGIKSALIYGAPSLIYEIEKTSVYTVGCMVYSQISLLKELYCPKNKNTINNMIENSIICAKENYDLIKSLIINSNCLIDNCDSGYFALFKIPYSILKTTSNMFISKAILKKCNVLTIPHDRYLYFNKDYYCFRINLLSSKDNLTKGITALITSFD